MLFLLIPILADIWLWYALITDLRHRNLVFKAIVLAVKASLTVVLLYLTIRIALYDGEFATAANSYIHDIFGLTGFLIIVAALASAFFRLSGLIARRIRHKETGIAGLLNIIFFLLIVILVADGHFRQRFDIRVEREDITIKGLNPALSGMKIVLISDLHLSSWYGNYDRLEDIMSMINQEDPDLLVNTGDFVSYGWQEFGRCDTILRKAHAKYGAFAVVGNHDDGTYHPGYDQSYGDECADMLRQSITASGYLLLSDTSVIVNCEGARVAIAGVVTHGHRLNMSYGDFSKALGQAPDSLFTILLLHDPIGWKHALACKNQPELTLSGHTHGMQLGLPGGHLSPSVWLHKTWRGLYRQGESNLFITVGLGTMGMAVRIFMPPEIVVITVKPG